MMNTLFSKVTGEHEKCLFTKTPNELFGQSNIYDILPTVPSTQ